jgi:hypothetical protein
MSVKKRDDEILTWPITSPKFAVDKDTNDFKTGPWSGHRYFAYDLIKFFKPRSIVELGSYMGISFFSFCQSILDNNIPCTLYAIDTWKGSQHDSYYGESIYSEFEQKCNTIFAKLDIKLIKKLFDQALDEFKDNSIDLLHIDGNHEYDHVKNDYTKWLGKVSENGVILFHDISPTLNLGVNKFWSEIADKSNSIQFPHSCGLGIFFPKKKKLLHQIKKTLVDTNLFPIYRYKSEAEYFSLLYQEAEKMLKARYTIMKKMDGMIKERDKRIASDIKLLNAKQQIIEKMDEAISERDKQIVSNTKLLQKKEDTIKTLEKKIQNIEVITKSSLRSKKKKFTLSDFKKSFKQIIRNRKK